MPRRLRRTPRFSRQCVSGLLRKPEPEPQPIRVRVQGGNVCAHRQHRRRPRPIRHPHRGVLSRGATIPGIDRTSKNHGAGPGRSLSHRPLCSPRTAAEAHPMRDPALSLIVAGSVVLAALAPHHPTPRSASPCAPNTHRHDVPSCTTTDGYSSPYGWARHHQQMVHPRYGRPGNHGRRRHGRPAWPRRDGRGHGHGRRIARDAVGPRRPDPGIGRRGLRSPPFIAVAPLDSLLFPYSGIHAPGAIGAQFFGNTWWNWTSTHT